MYFDNCCITETIDLLFVLWQFPVLMWSVRSRKVRERVKKKSARERVVKKEGKCVWVRGICLDS